MSKEDFINELCSLDRKGIDEIIKKNGKPQKEMYAFTTYDDDGNVIHYNNK